MAVVGCEIPIGAQACGVLAVGRCLSCGRAFCGSHQRVTNTQTYSNLCNGCETSQETARREAYEVEHNQRQDRLEQLLQSLAEKGNPGSVTIDGKVAWCYGTGSQTTDVMGRDGYVSKPVSRFIGIDGKTFVLNGTPDSHGARNHGSSLSLQPRGRGLDPVFVLSAMLSDENQWPGSADGGKWDTIRNKWGAGLNDLRRDEPEVYQQIMKAIDRRTIRNQYGRHRKKPTRYIRRMMEKYPAVKGYWHSV